LTGQAGTTASEARAAYADTESGVNISTLTEDAVTAARLGFDQPSVRSQDLHGAESDHAAVLILNIEDALSPDWRFSVASGSWKRICINLVTNALKYTPSGYINVTLHKTMLKRKPNKPQTALIELIVSVLLTRVGDALTDHPHLTRSKIPGLACLTSSKQRISLGLSGRRII
jgi:signal transduction histidine kinase